MSEFFSIFGSHVNYLIVRCIHYNSNSLWTKVDNEKVTRNLFLLFCDFLKFWERKYIFTFLQFFRNFWDKIYFYFFWIFCNFLTEKPKTHSKTAFMIWSTNFEKSGQKWPNPEQNKTRREKTELTFRNSEINYSLAR